MACTHPARPEWDTPHPLLPLLCTGRCSPLSQGTGSLGFPRPFLRAPLATLVHIFSTPAEHLHQPLAWPSTPPAALSPPSHTPQLAADSLRSYSRSLPHSRTHNGPTAWLIKFKFPAQLVDSSLIWPLSTHAMFALFPSCTHQFHQHAQPGPPTKTTQNCLAPTTPTPSKGRPAKNIYPGFALAPNRLSNSYQGPAPSVSALPPPSLFSSICSNLKLDLEQETDFPNYHSTN